MTLHKDVLFAEGLWALLWKDGSRAPLLMTVGPYDTPFYSAHHVGLTGSGGSNEIIAYGIGKENRQTGARTSLWNLPGGPVCGGDDVDQLGVQMVRALGPRPVGG
jgi:hypothetical protein